MRIDDEVVFIRRGVSQEFRQPQPRIAQSPSLWGIN